MISLFLIPIKINSFFIIKKSFKIVVYSRSEKFWFFHLILLEYDKKWRKKLLI